MISKRKYFASEGLTNDWICHIHMPDVFLLSFLREFRCHILIFLNIAFFKPGFYTPYWPLPESWNEGIIDHRM